MEKKQTSVVSFEECLRQALTGQRECLHAPKDPVEPGEVVLGTLEKPVARAFYSLWQEMGDGVEKFLKTVPESLPREKVEERRRLQCQMHQLHNRVDCVKSLFWELVYSDFPKARDPSVGIGIRENWSVVIFKTQSPLEQLFGARLIR